MDPSQLDNVHWVIFGSVVGFLLLAFILLYPVVRFLRREEEESRAWTPDQIARRQRGGGDGRPGPPPPPPDETAP